MHRIGDRIRLGEWQAAKPGETLATDRRRRGLRVSLHQLVHGVDDRRVEIPLVRAGDPERLVAVTEKRAQGPRQLDANEAEQQRPRSHDGERLAGIHAALFAYDT